MTLINVRDLPEVELLEYRLEGVGGWSDSLEDWAHELAEELFGISEYDIDEDDEALTVRAEYVKRLMRDESDAYWASHGWDVTNGKGKQLGVMDLFLLPMICLVEKLHPDAKFAHAADAWAAQLEAEAKAFKPKR